MKIKQKERTGATKTVSWTIITALLVLFFPVGIFLMLRKLHRDLSNAVSNGKKTAIVGWVFVGLGVFYLSGVLTGQVHAGEDGISSQSPLFVL